MFRCPSCSSTFVRPVRPAWWHRLRFRFTRKRLFACWHCDWKGWVVPEAGAQESTSHEHDAHGATPPATPTPPGDRDNAPHFFASRSAEPKTPAVAGSPQRR